MKHDVCCPKILSLLALSFLPMGETRVKASLIRKLQRWDVPEGL